MHGARTDPAQNLVPLKPIHYFVLVTLCESRLHGYGLIRQVKERSEGTVRVGPGSIHRALRQLTELGWVAEATRRPVEPALDDARRRYFEITPTGRRVASAETERLLRVAGRARTTILGEPS